MSEASETDIINMGMVPALDMVAKMVSKNEGMLRCLELAMVACKSSAPVMIIGEAGSGKSLLAMSIHHTSPRRIRPCLTLNCATIRERDIKNRLFGDCPAVSEQSDAGIGLMTKSSGGTLIIDAVDQMPGFVQKELLKVLLDTAKPGRDESSPRRFEARLISTSGSELAQRAANGLFVEELMYCLGEITIRIPPLRERREDIIDLAIAAVKAANQNHNKRVKGISRTAADFIRHYDFPGNIRELFLIIGRAVRDTSRDTIYVEDLGMMVDSLEDDPHLFSDMTLLPLSEMEKRHINKALLRTGWKKRAAARILRISESLLNRKIRMYGLERGSRYD